MFIFIPVNVGETVWKAHLEPIACSALLAILARFVSPVPRPTHRGTLHAELKWVKHRHGSHKISQLGTGYTLV